MDMGPIGVWSGELRAVEGGERAEVAAELDQLGYAAAWVPGGLGADDPDPLRAFGEMLDASSRLVLATGILSIWTTVPATVAGGHAALVGKHAGRFVLGLGVSHPHLVERLGHQWERPLEKMATYLDGLDRASPPVPEGERVLAALGPRMLELSRDRAAGAHPYLVSPDHTRRAREVLGSGPLLAPEQKVILDGDAARARSLARERVAMYLGAPNYRRNLLRMGFGPDDLDNGGSDRLVDSLVVWGDLDAVAARVKEHHDAGADHVCLQVLLPERRLPRDEWRRLAEALVPGGR
ncbi:MAG: LLM class F420-dependent oxidoreductase [Acidimicrobiales bacterium]|nr:LLM class F420-dependent oxidoreductase [Acidimicrobiales bacterium]